MEYGKWYDPKPKKSGWYLCTVENTYGSRYILPLSRDEYPPGNFSWGTLYNGQKVVACMPFPEKYDWILEPSRYDPTCANDYSEDKHG